MSWIAASMPPCTSLSLHPAEIACMDMLPVKLYLYQKICPFLRTILTISVKQLENGMSATTPGSTGSSIPSCVTLMSMGIETVHLPTILSATFFRYYQNSVVLSFVERAKRYTITFLSMMLSGQTSAH